MSSGEPGVLRAGTRPLALLASLVLLLGTSAAPAAPAAPSAKSLYENGLYYYKTGRFHAAAEAFEAVYAARPKPLLLFNIGQCHRKLGEFDQALSAYQRFLQTATAADPAEVKAEAQGYVDQIEKHFAELRRVRAPAPPPAAAPAPIPAPPPAIVPLAPIAAPAAAASRPPSSAASVSATTHPAFATKARNERAPTRRRDRVLRSPWLWTGVAVAATGLAVGLGVGLANRDRTPETTLGARAPSYASP